MQNDDLLPCPFCGGGEAEMSYYAKASSAEPAGHFIECASCAALGPPFEIQGEMPDRVEYTQSEAIAAWNARPISKVIGDSAELVDFLNEAARYFAKRPTGGEDMAHWANVYNSENCLKAAARIQALETQLAEVRNND